MSDWQTRLGHALTVLRRAGYDVRSTATLRILERNGEVIHAVPASRDALRDCEALGVWLVQQRVAHGLAGWGIS